MLSVYIEEGLALLLKRPRVDYSTEHAVDQQVEHTNMDFVANALAMVDASDLDRRRSLHPRMSGDRLGHGLSGQDVAATLERRRFERGLPQRIY